MIKEKILLVGCGRMGSALLEGFLPKVEDKKNVFIIAPKAEKLSEKYQVEAAQSIDKLGDFDPDIVILAVKPQIIGDIINSFKRFPKAVFVSVIAGKTINYFEKELGSVAVIRTMPNLPSLIGRGVTAAIANASVSDVSKKRIEVIFESVGSFLWLDKENDVDSVTAISGSGPAYLFYFTECLIESAKELGLSESIAKEIAYKMVSGSAELMENSDKSASELRVQVTSPGGTTAAALEVLMQKSDFKEVIKRATKAAQERSQKLSS